MAVMSYLNNVNAYTVVTAVHVSQLIAWVCVSNLLFPTNILSCLFTSISRIFGYLKNILGPNEIKITRFDCTVYEYVVFFSPAVHVYCKSLVACLSLGF